MFVGDITSKYTNIEKFITDNELDIRKIYGQCIKSMPADEYDSMDEYNTALAVMVACALFNNTTDIDNLVMDFDDEEHFHEVVFFLMLQFTIWYMTRRGLIEKVDTQQDTNGYRLTEKGEATLTAP